MVHAFIDIVVPSDRLGLTAKSRSEKGLRGGNNPPEFIDPPSGMLPGHGSLGSMLKRLAVGAKTFYYGKLGIMPGSMDMGMEPFGIIGAIWLFVVVLVLASIGLMIWAIYDIFTKQKRMPDVEKLIWVIVVVFLGFIGVIIYYLVVKASGKYEMRTGEETRMEEDEFNVY